MSETYTTDNIVFCCRRKLVHPVHLRAIVMRFEIIGPIEPVVEDMNTLIEASKAWEGDMVAAYIFNEYGNFTMPMGEVRQASRYDAPVGYVKYDHFGLIEVAQKMQHAKSLRLERNFNPNPSGKVTWIEVDGPHYRKERTTWVKEDDGRVRSIKREYLDEEAVL
jgi:hypothetical protein